MKYYAAIALILISTFHATAAEVAFSSLLKEMYDLERLTYMPDPAYTTKQFSSYDRRSTDPAVQTDENWYANGDRGNHIRVEERNGEKEWVLMDAEGPGAIVRFWSANSDDAGVMRIYLDNSDTPVIEMPLSDYLGGRSEIAPPPIAGMHGTGWNSYLPIPYAKHCKVTCSKPDFYYIINYRAYEAGAKVETYMAVMSKDEEIRKVISEVGDRLSNPNYATGQDSDYARSDVSFTLHPREGWPVLKVVAGPDPHPEVLARQTISDIESKEIPAAITELRVHVEDTKNLENILRGVLLEIYFDDSPTPQVQCPLGDFFGTAPGGNLYTSLPMGVLKNDYGVTLYSYLPMPYQKSFLINFNGALDKKYQFRLEVGRGKYTWTDKSLYFHAKWRQERDFSTRPRQDWNFATINGRGRYVGNMLHISNPVEGWWGEGDEKIYVDGEKFPSWFGTGSEDYYGYAWSSPMLFQHAYHNQTRCDGPGTYGNDSVNRFHILDDIPFNSSFKFDMEVWHWEDCKISQSAVSYWYAGPESTDNFESLEGKELIVPTIPPLPAPKRVEGALEGEEMKVISFNGGTHSIQTNSGWNWSNNAQLWWVDSAPGNALELGFAVEKAGKYKIYAVFTTAVDYGIVQPYINNEKAGDLFDAYNTTVKATEEILLGTFDLKKGENVFKAEITGANPKAIPKHMFGLDYLRLEKLRD